VVKQDGVYTVRARVADKDGGFTDFVVTGKVENAAPVITGVTNNSDSVGNATAGSTVRIGANFRDAGVLDDHTALIDWGDGRTSTLAASSSNGKGSAKGTHSYAQGGVYTVTIKVRDDANPAGVAVATTQVYVTGIGLRNGVLEIVGTDSRDRVDLSMDNRGNLRVKTDFARDASFNSRLVREVRATLGGGRDDFSADSDVRVPIYVDGVRYVPGRGSRSTPGITRSIFSDRLVA
jgi:hypothetical protein